MKEDDVLAIQEREPLMANQITYGDASRQAILRGVNSLANAVKVTLGPRGRNVILDKKFGSPTITKDGVTVGERNRLERPAREHGRPDGEGSREQDVTTSPATARRPRRCWRRRFTARARRMSPPARTRWPSSAASRRRSRPSTRELKKHVEAGQRADDRAGRHDLGEP